MKTEHKKAHLRTTVVRQKQRNSDSVVDYRGWSTLSIAGARTEPQGGGIFQILITAGGLGLVTTGFIVAFDNS